MKILLNVCERYTSNCPKSCCHKNPHYVNKFENCKGSYCNYKKKDVACSATMFYTDDELRIVHTQK